MSANSEEAIIARIKRALERATEAIAPFGRGCVKTEYKSGKHPVTEADRAANRVLHEALVTGEEGWLSEESVDDLSRLDKKRVWVVDPLDGTRQYIDGTPEWSISIGLVQDGEPIAGGICNPATEETIIGSLSSGVTYNGKACKVLQEGCMPGALVLASRTEVERGEWKQVDSDLFKIRPIGSIAYKLALVAAGQADATWTLQRKHEWDIAAGVALVRAGGGIVRHVGNDRLIFNKEKPVVANLLACGARLAEELPAYITQLGKKRPKHDIA